MNDPADNKNMFGATWAENPVKTYERQPTQQERIDKRVAEKDANFYVLNASNAAAGIVSSLIQIGDKNATLNPLAAFEKLRDEIIDSNLNKSKSLQ